MLKRRTSSMTRRMLTIAFIGSILCIAFTSISVAQQNGQQNSTPSSPTSPGGGITSGTAPIETTLFAYRSLASDADAISREVLARAAKNSKVVIGTPTDLAAFVQWRMLMQEALLLDERARQIHDDFPSSYPPDWGNGHPVPLATLSVAASYVTQTTNPTNLEEKKPIMFILTVSNTSGSSSVATPVTVTLTLPAGWSLLTSDPGAPKGYSLGPPMGGDQKVNWTCSASADQGSMACTRSDALQPYSTYQEISVYATVGPPPSGSAPAPVATVALTGGGSAPPTPLAITLPVPKAAAPIGTKLAAPAEQTSQSSPTTSTSAGAGGPLASLTSALPVFATALGQAFAVQQTLSVSQGSMTDTPLINMVAERLQEASVTVLIPSIYTPHLLRNGTLQDTYLWQILVRLEKDRALLWNDLAAASKVLSKATYVTQNPTKYSPANVTTALEYSGQLQSLSNSAQAVATNIDSLETSLFGGQTGTQSQGQNQNSASPAAQTGNPSGNQNNNPPSNQPNSTTPNQTNNSQASPPSNPSNPAPAQNSQNNQQQSTPSGGQPSSLLPQILGADLLAHAVWGDPNWDVAPRCAAKCFEKNMDQVRFLTLHALESGGSQLNKSNFFYGTHIFFSGGSVATFGLYKVSGEVMCSGFAYDYEGNVREKRYDRALRLPQLPAIITTDFSTCKPEDSKQITLRKGMTTPEAFAAANVPYRAIAVKGSSYIYEFDDLNHTRIVVKDGMVIKVMKSR